MDLSGRLVLLKSSAKEKDYPAYTPEDVIFLFEEITCPEGVILDHSDPSGWGAPMLLTVRYTYLLIVCCIAWWMLELHDNIC